MRHATLLALLATVFVPVHAEECRVLYPAPQQGDRLVWHGACRDGMAEGPGVISLDRPGKTSIRYEVTLAHGDIAGEGALLAEDGKVYAGTFHQGQPHGRGYFRFANGATYEGEVAHGQPEGQGTWTSQQGTRYVGQWKAGKKQGRGRIEYALGGSYDGDWSGDTYNGHGVLTYAGSGRRVEGEFHDGWPAGVARPAPVEPSSERYVLREDMPRTGTSIRREIVSAPVPLDKGYAELTPGQRAVVRQPYEALAASDEPPYPLGGPKLFYEALAKAFKRIGASGELKLLVRVGADGVAQSVTAIGAPTPELVRFASGLVMLQQYKPAVCDGKPCDMIYPAYFKFEALQ
ncbi:MAG TPA: hypothetical protein VNT33_11280 [Telluria sp.]|nr:hypothetical protein [Telluria sp.]